MKTSLSPEATREIEQRLREANAAFSAAYPGDSGARQPVHTVYGGAHLFKAETGARLGGLPLRCLYHCAPYAAPLA